MSAPEPILVIAARAAMTCTCGHYRNMHFRANSFCMAEVVDDNEERDACSCDYFTSIVKAVHADE